MFSNERTIDKKHYDKIVPSTNKRILEMIDNGTAFAWSVGKCSDWKDWLAMCKTCYKGENEWYCFVL